MQWFRGSAVSIRRQILPGEPQHLARRWTVDELSVTRNGGRGRNLVHTQAEHLSRMTVVKEMEKGVAYASVCLLPTV